MLELRRGHQKGDSSLKMRGKFRRRRQSMQLAELRVLNVPQPAETGNRSAEINGGGTHTIIPASGRDLAHPLALPQRIPKLAAGERSARIGRLAQQVQLLEVRGEGEGEAGVHGGVQAAR